MEFRSKMNIPMKPKTSRTKRHTAILSKIYAGNDETDAKAPVFSPNRWLITLFIIGSILLALSSCEETIEERPFQDFIIPNGARYASPRLFERFESERLAFTATFDESAVYDVEDASAGADKNILMGFTDCSSFHDANSARFAWQWISGRLDIYAHCYVDGIKVEQYIGAVNLNQANRYEIAVTESQYTFYVNGEQKAEFGRHYICDEGANYVLFPYFAEPVAAPHNIRVQIEMLN